MGQLRRFRALRSHAEKLYRIDQGKALGVLNEELKPGRFDDVQSGVCAALCVVWLQAMLKMKKLPRLRDQFKFSYAPYRPYRKPSGLFVGTPAVRDIARSLTKPKLLTNQDVVALQRQYKQVVLDEPPGRSSHTNPRSSSGRAWSSHAAFGWPASRSPPYRIRSASSIA